MPRKQWTAEQRAAFGASMKAKRQAKKLQPVSVAEQQDPLSGPQPEQVPEMVSNQDYQELKREVEELRAMFKAPQQSAQLTQGGVVGTVIRYRLDGYPDPRKRLALEPKLNRFAFDRNFELSWEVVPVRYQTIDNIWRSEPKFTLELIRIMLDEDTGEDTNKRYVICRGIFFEDPDAAVVVAHDNGLAIDEMNVENFLNEMRYIRMRDWLIEAFYPPKPTQPKSNKREMVIGNKLVEVFEVNSETSETIPFGQLKNKL